MIEIRTPLSFTEIGKKDKQEDYVYPQSLSGDDHAFVLCDGMGGHEQGEVASRMVATCLGSLLSATIHSGTKIDTESFENALAATYDDLDTMQYNASRRPGTTMTCVALNDDSVLVAHIGDSRIYQVRPSAYNHATGRGGIVFQTTDHSLVNDLLRAGELTEEQAQNFAHKNIITRAMQPGLTNRYAADIATLTDVRGGDYFFMCCDGVLERMTNADLCRILADDSLDDAGKLAAIKAICDQGTRDNYTCLLIPIQHTEGMAPVVEAADNETADIIDDQAIAIAPVTNTDTPDAGEEDVEINEPKTAQPKKRKSRAIVWLYIAAIIIIGAVALLLYQTMHQNSDVKTPANSATTDTISAVSADKPIVKEEQPAVTDNAPAPQADKKQDDENIQRAVERRATEAVTQNENDKNVEAPQKPQSNPAHPNISIIDDQTDTKQKSSPSNTVNTILNNREK